MAKKCLKDKLAELAESFNWEYLNSRGGVHHIFKKRGEKYLMELSISKAGQGFCEVRYSFIPDPSDPATIRTYTLKETRLPVKNLNIKQRPIEESVQEIFWAVFPLAIYESLLGEKHQRISWLQDSLSAKKKELKQLKELKPWFEEE